MMMICNRTFTKRALQQIGKVQTLFVKSKEVFIRVYMNCLLSLPQIRGWMPYLYTKFNHYTHAASFLKVYYTLALSYIIAEFELSFCRHFVFFFQQLHYMFRSNFHKYL